MKQGDVPYHIDLCLKYLREKKYEQCLVLAEQLAMNGSHVAAVLVAQIHLTGGTGIQRNLTLAEMWQRKAIGMRSTIQAQVDLAKILLLYDNDIKKRQGVKLLLRLARQGRSAKLFLTLGAVFADGIAVHKNNFMAIKLFTRALRESRSIRLSLGSVLLISICAFKLIFHNSR